MPSANRRLKAKNMEKNVRKQARELDRAANAGVGGPGEGKSLPTTGITGHHFSVLFNYHLLSHIWCNYLSIQKAVVPHPLSGIQKAVVPHPLSGIQKAVVPHPLSGIQKTVVPHPLSGIQKAVVPHPLSGIQKAVVPHPLSGIQKAVVPHPLSGIQNCIFKIFLINLY
uniref:Small EDRK-rich factor-like N-terminal domain-containing protein n=1 Tax=Ditylenchus dipsaci TaxID=166011 RepID=A0A915DKZ1_9BILA